MLQPVGCVPPTPALHSTSALEQAAGTLSLSVPETGRCPWQSLSLEGWAGKRLCGLWDSPFLAPDTEYPDECERQW